VNNVKKLIFQVFVSQSRIVIEKNNKGGRRGEGAVCLAHNQTTTYITIKNYQKLRTLHMDFVLCILIMHLFVFIFPWHDQTSIFGHW
jgi:hypothetical protein